MGADYPARRIRARVREAAAPLGNIILYWRSSAASWGDNFELRWAAGGGITLQDVTGGGNTVLRSGTIARSNSGVYDIEISDSASGEIVVTVNGASPFASITTSSKTSSAFSYVGFELGTINGSARLDWISWDR